MTRPSIRLTVFGRPQPKGSSRAFLPKNSQFPVVTSANPNLKDWEACIRSELQLVMSRTPRPILEEMFHAPIAVTLIFHVARPKSLKRGVTEPTKKPDLDKLVRGAVDAMNGVLFHDDAQVVAIGSRKRYAESATKLDILIESWASMHTLAVAAILSTKEPHGNTPVRPDQQRAS